MLAVEPAAVPDGVRVTLPFALIEPQLSQGRVSVRREVFIQALPEMHRHVFSTDGPSADISIPLQEVFQNLPANALSLRADQVKEETGSYYPTPFSQKAEEDAQRFAASQAIQTPAAAPEAEAAVPASDVEAASDAPAAATPVDDSADTVTDLPHDHLLTPEPAADVALPTDSAPEPARDIPLDLGGGATVETPPETSAPPKDAAPETPVEARGDAPVEETQAQDESTVEAPAAEAPAVETPDAEPSIPEIPAAVIPAPPPEVQEPEPLSEIVEPAASLALETAPAEPFIAEAPVVAPEALVPPAAAKKDPVAPELTLPPLPVETPAGVQEMAAPVKETPPTAKRPVQAHDNALQVLFMTEDELDAKTVVKLVCQLPSVTGCAVMFEDGLRLAGNFPEGDTEGFSAMAPPFFKRAARFVTELELGSLQTFSLHTEHGLLSFFMHDNICLSVRHTGRGFMPGVREKLEIVTRELSRMYTTAKPDKDAE